MVTHTCDSTVEAEEGRKLAGRGGEDKGDKQNLFPWFPVDTSDYEEQARRLYL